MADPRGRKPAFGKKMLRLQVMVPQQMLSSLDAFCVEAGKSKSWVARRALEKFMDSVA